MTNNERKIIYHKDHILAKIICCLINSILVLLYVKTNSLVFLLLANVTYFFGVSTLGYIIESVKGHQHLHEKI